MAVNWQERTELLVRGENLQKLRNAVVVIAGLGGVGAFAAEMIVRAGIRRIVIIDSDRVSDSNRNRQLLALTSTVGEVKCEVMKERMLDINPEAQVETVEEYITPENVAGLLEKSSARFGGKIDFLIDAIDTLAPKIALISHCVHNNIPLVSSMGAGAKFDATKVRLTDISKSFNCPLAYMLRKKLRKIGISKGFKVVFSEELPDREAIVPTEGEKNKKSQTGTISYLPAVFGCVCAQAAITYMISQQNPA